MAALESEQDLPYNMYIQNVYMKIEWDPLKSKKLKLLRSVSFEQIIGEELLDVLEHPVKANQKILVYKYKDYCWAVPCVMTKGGMFLKTIYSSRKLTKKYLKKEL